MTELLFVAVVAFAAGVAVGGALGTRRRPRTSTRLTPREVAELRSRLDR